MDIEPAISGQSLDPLKGQEIPVADTDQVAKAVGDKLATAYDASDVFLGAIPAVSNLSDGEKVFVIVRLVFNSRHHFGFHFCWVV